jgi:hypothetical protein
MATRGRVPGPKGITEFTEITLSSHFDPPHETTHAFNDAEVTEGHERPLTSQEIMMARLVFQDSIDYKKVLVHNHGYWAFFGLDGENNASTPNGEIYFYATHYKRDFSQVDNYYKAWFIHEMTHAWQYQLGYCVKLKRIFNPRMPYKYKINPKNRLNNYNMEQQAQLISDYFSLKFLWDKDVISQIEYSGDLNIYEDILSDFNKNPKNKSNLPS